MDFLNVNNWLLEQGISQRTLFNWFGFNTPGVINYDPFVYLGKSSSFLFTAETYNLFINSLYQKIRFGFLLTDLRNICIWICWIRFFLLLFRYNLITSLKIVAISFISGLFWYYHLEHVVFSKVSTIVQTFPFFATISQSYEELVRLRLVAMSDRVAGTEFKDTFHILWNDMSIGEIYLNKSDPSLYRCFRWYEVPDDVTLDWANGDVIRLLTHIDPAALFIQFCKRKSIPGADFLIKTYYLFERYLNRKLIFTVFPKVWAHIENGLLFTLVTRMGKKYCPYFIRWHVTFLFLLESLESFLVPVWARMYDYVDFVIQPKYEAYFNQGYYDYNEAAVLADMASLTTPYAREYLFYILSAQFGVATLFTFHTYGLLHALCGQYFYFPFITECTELHVGPRNKNSIYSGGETAWQGLDINTLRFWHGWFGRGTDKPNLFWLLLKWVLIKVLEILRLKKIFLKFFKFLRNKFKKQK